METAQTNTLPKEERLCGKTGISHLLAKGRHGNVPNMRYLCLKNNGKEFNRIMVSVPKKLFMYSTKEVLSYEEIYKTVGQIIRKINESE